MEVKVDVKVYKYLIICQSKGLINYFRQKIQANQLMSNLKNKGHTQANFMSFLYLNLNEYWYYYFLKRKKIEFFWMGGES